MSHCIKIFFVFFIFNNNALFAQQCNCEKEFISVKNKMEQSYAGFNDKLVIIKRSVYNKRSSELAQLTKTTTAKEKCLLIILSYLNLFQDRHVYVEFSPAINNIIIDSSSMKNKEMIAISESKMKALKQSKGIEGIYYFRSDSSYKIAVLKSPTPMRDYVGVMLESKVPHWKKGMVKFEVKKADDNMYKGVLYVRSHIAKNDLFAIGENTIGGDWQREGTLKEAKPAEPYMLVASRSLSPKTFYIKISSFDAGNAKNIDSLFKVNKSILDTTANLILDLRNNGGGADFAYAPLVPYIYTNPLKTIGVDALSTELNIETWRKILDMKDLPDETKEQVKSMITKMENNKGKFVNIVDDETDTSYSMLPYPKQIIVLVNKGCASTAEQFLLAALQSKKVRLMGEHTGGVLDYANVRETNFDCMPYILNYPTTRSRRVDVQKGIDNVGIKPHITAKSTDWIEEALKILEP